MSAQKNVEWLRHLVEQYRSTTNDMCEALEEIERDKSRVSRTYNKRVTEKLFQVGDLI
jgi:hypothetical protein